MEIAKMGDIELQIFSDRLKQLRIEKGLTQAQFVDGLGITTSALSAYEKNQKNPSISVAKRIAEKYNISLDWLCGISENVTEKKIETYADVILALNSLLNCKNLDAFLFSTANPTYNGPSEHSPEIPAIAFDNLTIIALLEDWMKYRQVGSDDELNKNINQMWLEQIKKKYNDIIEILPFNA